MHSIAEADNGRLTNGDIADYLYQQPQAELNSVGKLKLEDGIFSQIADIEPGKVRRH